MDFTVIRYKELFSALRNQGFSFLTFEESVSKPEARTIVLRHDVDKLPDNSLRFARIQADLGISGTYYFRAIPESWDERIIKEIAVLGHEVGYHYEDVNLAAERHRAQGAGHSAVRSRKYVVCSKEYEEYEQQIADIAIASFSENLEKLRKIVPVKTICMHGSPMSRWDSRLLWKYYDYYDFGIVGEPYFDIDFDEVLYLTDTGRRWDGEGVSVRDKAIGEKEWEKGRRGEGEKSNPFEGWKVKPFKYRDNPLTEQEVKRGKLYPPNNIPLAPFKGGTQNPAPFTKFHSTSDIIKAAENYRLPDKIMMTFHPQRWTDKLVPWVRELVWQNVKNVGKYFLVRKMR